MWHYLKLKLEYSAVTPLLHDCISPLYRNLRLTERMCWHKDEAVCSI